eukprot:5534749-Pleurochrysis_carterae.AAC.1
MLGSSGAVEAEVVKVEVKAGMSFQTYRSKLQACTGGSFSHPDSESEELAPYELGTLASAASPTEACRAADR